MNQFAGCLTLIIVLSLILAIALDDQYNLFHFTVVLFLGLNALKVEGGD